MKILYNVRWENHYFVTRKVWNKIAVGKEKAFPILLDRGDVDTHIAKSFLFSISSYRLSLVPGLLHLQCPHLRYLWHDYVYM